MSASLRGLGAVIDQRTETLILGSFPSSASLTAAQYYAHPRNQFWPILGELLGMPMPELPYEERLRELLDRKLGLWDVMGACERQGSLDADIRKPQLNEFSALREAAPRLLHIGFNGATAGRQAPVLSAAGYCASVLPSTSAAHARTAYAEKLAVWRLWWNRSAGH